MSASTLEIKGLSKNYGGVTALRSVDVSVRAGEVHGIIGPNGAGKSTLVDIVSGFTARSEGTIEVGGRAIGGRPHRLARAGIVRTFQHTSVFQGETVMRNLEIAVSCLARRFGGRHRGVDRGGIDAVLETLRLADQRSNVAESLSYGAQRRLAIAIALVCDPTVLLLDEPAAGMNPVESEEFVELIREIRRDRTVVLIEHDMSVIRALCDRSTVLVDGQVLTSGPTSEVLDDERVIDVYLGVSA
jgi:ABC-type branched-subunit amino acid transport system ATPase component